MPKRPKVEQSSWSTRASLLLISSCRFSSSSAAFLLDASSVPGNSWTTLHLGQLNRVTPVETESRNPHVVLPHLTTVGPFVCANPGLASCTPHRGQENWFTFSGKHIKVAQFGFPHLMKVCAVLHLGHTGRVTWLLTLITALQPPHCNRRLGMLACNGQTQHWRCVGRGAGKFSTLVDWFEYFVDVVGSKRGSAAPKWDRGSSFCQRNWLYSQCDN